MKEIEALKKELAEKERPQNENVFLTTSEARAKAQHEMLAKRAHEQRTGTANMLSGNMENEYQFPEWEKNLVHLRITKRPPENVRGKTFVTEDGKTFEKTELPTQIWKGAPRQYDRMEKGNSFKAYQGVKILHDPRK